MTGAFYSGNMQGSSEDGDVGRSDNDVEEEYGDENGDTSRDNTKQLDSYFISNNNHHLLQFRSDLLEFSFPPEIDIRSSGGVWSKAVIPKGIRWPFFGKWLGRPIDPKYSWETQKSIEMFPTNLNHFRLHSQKNTSISQCETHMPPWNILITLDIIIVIILNVDYRDDTNSLSLNIASVAEKMLGFGIRCGELISPVGGQRFITWSGDDPRDPNLNRMTMTLSMTP
ncbi:hypothetical protein M8J75_005287 [Diaphorina citri]|nr:hypothetical protein M8J75_005287 [Diaphorina citri]